MDILYFKRNCRTPDKPSHCIMQNMSLSCSGQDKLPPGPGQPLRAACVSALSHLCTKKYNNSLFFYEYFSPTKFWLITQYLKYRYTIEKKCFAGAMCTWQVFGGHYQTKDIIFITIMQMRTWLDDLQCIKQPLITILFSF